MGDAKPPMPPILKSEWWNCRRVILGAHDALKSFQVKPSLVSQATIPFDEFLSWCVAESQPMPLRDAKLASN
jgi:hypothetical protein